jgi:DNA helicase-2/ATP-dependent DNA helicase PcrA
VRLEQNYRSTKRILRVADALIANNVRRKQKRLFTENQEGPPVRLATYPTQLDEARDIADQIAAAVRQGKGRPGDFAVFYRVNALSRSLEIALRERGVPYQLVNSVEFYQRREIKDVLAYLHLVNNPHNDVALLRVINVPPRGIGPTTVERLAEHARAVGRPLFEAARESGLIAALPKRAAAAVAAFVATLDRIAEARDDPVARLIRRAIKESGYEAMLKESDDEQDEDRLANIQELVTAARQFDDEHPHDGGLEAFLEQTSLVSDTDALSGEADRVALMTIHSAKGLEFESVFIVAAEQGLLPHERSIADPAQFEEERRLLFVAITRARRALQISRARYRDFRGQVRMTVPSAFLMELPREQMEQVEWEAGLNVREDRPRGTWSEEDEVSGGRVRHGRKVGRRGRRAEQSSPRGLRTAAELATPSPTASVSKTTTSPAAVLNPDSLAEGTMVRHPKYGIGVVTSVGGQGRRRTATVHFLDSGDARNFVLAQSPLTPM